MNEVPQGEAAGPTPAQRQILKNLLQMFKREIHTTFRPELTSGFAFYTADVIEMMLGHMVDAIGGGAHPQTDAARLALVNALEAFDETKRTFIPEFDDDAGVDEQLAGLISKAAADGNTEVLAALGPKVAAIDDELYTAEGVRHAEASARDAAFMASIDWQVTPALFDRYATEKLGLSDPARTVITIPGGHSKDTFLIALESGRELVIRRDFPFGPVEGSAADEFEVLAHIYKSGLPVARPLAAERDKSYLGQNFLVMEKVAGRDAHIAGLENNAHGKSVSLELARILARLHRMDPADAGMSLGGDARATVAAYLQRWRVWWDRHRVHPSSLCEAGFAWLERNVPADLPRAVIVHGDARPGNMLAIEGVTTGLLDWEFAHAGDPAEDLLYAKGFVAPFVGWEEFLTTYLEAGGQPIGEAGRRYYDVFRSLRNVVCCDVSWSGFVRGKYPALKLAAQGVVYKRMLAQDLAKSMREVSW